MKVLIVYDSFFGNTKQVAEAMKNQLSIGHDCRLTKVDYVTTEDFMETDLLIVGSPTRGFEPTKPIVKFMKHFFEVNMHCRLAVFDTRMDVEAVNNFVLTFLTKRKGYAGTTFGKLADKYQIELVVKPEGFIVLESEGPMKDGELERAAKWAESVVALVEV